MNEKIRAAIIGGSLDGKTFLASGFSRGLWRAYGFRSLVFDPYKGETAWGPQALVFGSTEAERGAGVGNAANLREFDRFRRLVFSVKRSQKFAIFWDEATTNGGRDADNLEFFTAVRHNSDAFFCIGHSFTAVLPTMRVNISDAFLSAGDPEEFKKWASLLADSSLTAHAVSLKKYEFLHKRKHSPARVLRYTKEQILAGIVP